MKKDYKKKYEELYEDVVKLNYYKYRSLSMYSLLFIMEYTVLFPMGIGLIFGDMHHTFWMIYGISILISMMFYKSFDNKLEKWRKKYMEGYE